MIKIYTHQNNPETITLNICQEKIDFEKDIYCNQTYYHVEAAKEVLQQLNEAAFEISEWIQERELNQKKSL